MDLPLSIDRESDMPMGAQLAAQLRAAVRQGALADGAQLPSVRALAADVGVHVNTVRAVYQRLENEGVARSEQGRGTFVARGAADMLARRELHDEIADLESRLVHRPLPAGAGEAVRPGTGRLLSTAELTAVRNALVSRLDELDAERRDVQRRLEELRLNPAAATGRAGADTSSRPRARVRWVTG